ncbi:MAG TPA: hypothetical protein VFG39_02110 [Balneolaceae bacterium]|nr:hypothetical protein [Balneolaceae bacterium]
MGTTGIFQTKRLAILFIALVFALTSCSVFQSSAEKEFKGIAYANAKYDVVIQYPQNWRIIDKRSSDAEAFAINILKKGILAEKRLPLGVYADMQLSYVAIWPHGLGTELPQSQRVSLKDTTLSLDFNFAVDQKESTLLLLKDGSIWAYFLRPEQPPASWSNYGFIFAQVSTLQSSIRCYDDQTGKQLSLQECDYSKKDYIIRTGTVDQEDAAAIRYILENIRLTEVKR